MPRDTTAAKDVHICITVPCGGDGEGEPDPSRCAPWGAPISREAAGGRPALLKQLLEGIVPLLEVLQAAHRAGQLAREDLEELSRLQAWYSCLQLEHEHLRQPPAPER